MPTALISVSNKEGIVEFAKNLADLGWEIISTGGTFEVLYKSGIKNLKKVEEITGFSEIMDGRVKTLHPKIFGGILADRSKDSHLSQAKDNQIPLIDMVVCNLYPFEKILSQLSLLSQLSPLSPLSQEDRAKIIENIDIGGVTLLRAAAKNYQDVIVVCDSADYQEVLENIMTEDLRLKTNQGIEFRKKMALKAFKHTARYDEMIANCFSDNQNLDLHFEKVSDLRYGENPHQQSTFYKDVESSQLGIVNAKILHGKQLSFNNILDADAALALIREFNESAAAVLKHTNPCGCAVSDDITDAFKKAYAADSLSAFGGIIVINRKCTKEIAEEINKVFAEIVIAPEFNKDALIVLKQKKNIRLIKIPDTGYGIRDTGLRDYKKITGGLLEQDYDNQQITESDIKVASQKKPTASQIKDLLFAWKVVKHIKSNAIVIVKDGVTVGIGAGQMSRVDAVDIAIKKGTEKITGAAVASDGFFPFADSVEKLHKAGIISIIQPGGSIKDDEVIKAVDEHGLSMVFTGVRGFRH